jgi:hypothetical protein
VPSVKALAQFPSVLANRGYELLQLFGSLQRCLRWRRRCALVCLISKSAGRRP